MQQITCNTQLLKNQSFNIRHFPSYKSCTVSASHFRPKINEDDDGQPFQPKNNDIHNQ